MVDVLPAHTRLSASSAKRWMECPGSIHLAETLGSDIDEDESEFAAEGTAAHEAAAHCLIEHLDTWAIVGDTFYDREVDSDMADHIQTYLDYVRELTDGADKLVVETRVDDPTIHPDFGGTADAYAFGRAWLHVFDFKYGAGIAVDAVNNTQMKYYAAGVLKMLRKEWGSLRELKHVGMTIVQPRAFHTEGPIREAWVDTNEILEWCDDELVPAMHAVDKPGAPLQAGEWCRFCPARTVCPLMKGMFGAAATANIAVADKMDDRQLGLEMERVAQVKMYIKALEDQTFQRLMKGQKIPGQKLVHKKAARVWKKGADDALREQFGDDAYEKPKLRSPAQVEKLQGGKPFSSKWGFKPQTGYTVAPATDSKPSVSVANPLDTFARIGQNKD